MHVCFYVCVLTDLQTNIHLERNKTYGLLPSGDSNGLPHMMDDADSDVPNHQAPTPPIGAAVPAFPPATRAVQPPVVRPRQPLSKTGIAGIKGVTDSVWDDPDIPDGKTTCHIPDNLTEITINLLKTFGRDRRSPLSGTSVQRFGGILLT